MKKLPAFTILLTLLLPGCTLPTSSSSKEISSVITSSKESSIVLSSLESISSDVSSGHQSSFLDESSISSSEVSLSISSLESVSKKESSSYIEDSSDIPNSSRESSSSIIPSSSIVSSSYTTSNSQPEVDPRWNVNFNEYGSTFRDTLASSILDKVSKTGTKSSCLSIGAAAAAVSGGKFVPFYHSTKVTTTTSSCNREHTWPDSRGGGTKQGGGNIEKDPFMLRPTLTSDNSSRGNKFYGLGLNEWDPASCESGFYEARGEAARIIFYVATRYYASNGVSLSNNPNDAGSLRTMGTLKYLIEWNNKYPPTTIEKQVNNYLSSQGYGRNPFVDHPEYANYIWSTSGLRTSPVNGGNVTPTSSIAPSNHVEINYQYTLEDSLEDIDGASYIIANSLTGVRDLFN